ncbi:MAG: nickel-dependent lactate racemase [Abditibacteriales bacterium]|nr:nickel-dependent lactate racemase [Abditibacteriales bacterium]MDW8366395.1 lactate racemase domain-containing protein [Abditibacteriales bacterium]
MRLPRMVKVQQDLYDARVDDVRGAVHDELRAVGLDRQIRKGMRIAITAGSRGVASIDKILAAVVEFICDAGGKPFLFPAMGSHGGGTPEGQIGILETLNVTEQTVGAPIHATMDTKVIGKTVSGHPVHIDRYAHEADGVIAVNRIKWHTDFSGKIESGLCKIMAIGMGKIHGAEYIHTFGSKGLRDIIPECARVMIDRNKLLMGLAVIENGAHEVARLVAVPPDKILEAEERLLRFVKRRAPKVPFKDIDVLIVDRMGKNISGAGMDTKTIGRMKVKGEPEPAQPNPKAIVVLDLTDESHGNAAGIGLADFTTQRLANKIDWHHTALNTITSGFLWRINMPYVLPTDEEAVWTALQAARATDPKTARVVRIQDTLSLRELYVSEAMLPEVEANPTLHRVGKPQPMQFQG